MPAVFGSAGVREKPERRERDLRGDKDWEKA